MKRWRKLPIFSRGKLRTMDFREHVPLGPKTTMRIGGTARYFAELRTKEEIEHAWRFAHEHALPLIPLGSGSNTIFADGEIAALIVQVKRDTVAIEGSRVTVGAGKNLAMLINELASAALDLSALTGIPGTVGGAIVGNAGQGPQGVWIDAFVESVTVYDEAWRTFPREACGFGYRESAFKHATAPTIVVDVTLLLPSRDTAAITQDIQALLQRRIQTQPHARTAGSCFKAVGGVPAWKLIDEAGLRGHRVGDIAISTKHANFLESGEKPTFADAVRLVHAVQAAIPTGLEVEMRFVNGEGRLVF